MPPRRWKTNTGIIGRPHAKSVRYEDRGIVKAVIGVLGRSSVLINSQPSLRSSLVLQFLHARFEERNGVFAVKEHERVELSAEVCGDFVVLLDQSIGSGDAHVLDQETTLCLSAELAIGGSFQTRCGR